MKTLAPKRGKLLISEPSIIGDASFSRSVVLLTEFNSEGIVGFIINKPLDYTLDELVPEIHEEFEVYDGGPVSTDNLYFLHRIPDLIPDSHHIEDGIYWGGDFQTVSALINQNKIASNEIKFFLGYSGWERHQLQEELDSKSWVVTDNEDSAVVLSDEIHDIWKIKMRDLGDGYEIWSNAPENPSYN
ncbi:putative transcriptional regulator [Nonlabens sp. Hel1_33_55]|uniref:YqgE/AlgH family protein n=1 Tax=Nonlabens sp. Hel1_33_55 TaxID=1336802 RepID=UPI000875B31A|nr:YqgE/AlgH family protein [Nonlabens sp. Hel1_33_55]SCY01080.1 putative transcriptional regulator [Nonlabens sp. Hel1_33_55]